MGSVGPRTWSDTPWRGAARLRLAAQRSSGTLRVHAAEGPNRKTFSDLISSPGGRPSTSRICRRCTSTRPARTWSSALGDARYPPPGPPKSTAWSVLLATAARGRRYLQAGIASPGETCCVNPSPDREEQRRDARVCIRQGNALANPGFSRRKQRADVSVSEAPTRNGRPRSRNAWDSRACFPHSRAAFFAQRKTRAWIWGKPTARRREAPSTGDRGQQKR
jgi:hypothetical protein